jgi:hypothetical protein
MKSSLKRKKANKIPSLTEFSICLAMVIAALTLYLPVVAYDTQLIENTPITGDVLLGPAKVEINLDPGESKTFELSVLNKTGHEQSFHIDIEDFEGSADSKQVVELLENKKSDWTLKNFLFVSERDFALKHGERAKIPVSLSVPIGSEPGGKFASILISFSPENSQQVSEYSVGSRTISIPRIGVLVFATVNGDVRSDGRLESFSVLENMKANKDSVIFRILYRNDGNVHLNPYGFIEIADSENQIVDKLEIEPWFVLPQTLRTREISHSVKGVPGSYTAKIYLNRGYDDVVDEKTVTFSMGQAGSSFVAFFVLFLVLFIALWVWIFRRKKTLDQI